jgi:2-oxoglutarate ferredoxin oxidoreductase subunit delta
MNKASDTPRLAEETPKTKKPRGEVTVLMERCKACGSCVVFCPKDVLTMSDEFNERGYHFPCVTKAEDCTGCKLCELLCGEFAVFVKVNKPDKTCQKEGE